MSPRIYFDHSATTPMDPRVLAAMGPYLAGSFGNPSSLYQEGREARQAVERARGQVAGLIGAEVAEVVFTASGTEADNLALLGAVGEAGGGGHVIVSAIEHPAILETVKHLERAGVAVSLLPVNGEGIAEVSSLPGLLRADTRLVSVMAANNVTGVLQPIAELARGARAHGALFHTDAVQAAGKIPLDVGSLPADLLTLSAHKLHGPKGVGALYVRKGTPLSPIIFGGGQERGLRSATENVAGIVGFGEAAALAKAELVGEAARLVTLREHLWEGVRALVPNAYLAGHPFRRLPGHLCLGFSGQENEAIKLLLALDEAGVAVSSGSACSASHAGQPSHVLQAMGFDPIRARGSLRVTLGRFSTKDEVDQFLDILPSAVASLRPAASHAGFGASR